MSSNEIIIGSANVFEDLGFSPQEAENLRIRSDLMLKITKLVEAQGWGIEQAGSYLGISGEWMEALNLGKISEFSIEQLMTMLTHAGMKLKVEILPEVA